MSRIDQGSDRASEQSGDAVVRPAPHRWIWYALGGALPERNHRWVLHDTTTGTWWLRHIARTLVQVAIPIVLVMALLPAGWGLRTAAAGGGLALALFYSLAYMPETTENRVMKAGYPAGTATSAAYMPETTENRVMKAGYPAGTATSARERAGLGRAQRESERKRAAAARRTARYRERTGR